MSYDDDDGMPPLVDNPLPPMTFTFTTYLPPIGYSIRENNDDGPPESLAPDMSMDSPPGTPMLGPARVSHSKRRDASYIPRPPNAFILFRSSFIKAQHIPGQIEGNHSALSKIIGKCWKALPREEREVWEAKAIVALAEHRQKYPDWRFKPAANALAKVKDGPRKRGNRKGRGQSEKEERSREKRCAKIADLLVAGKTGSDLAAAVEQYDCEVGSGRGRKLKDEGGCGGVPQLQGEIRDGAVVNADADVKVQIMVESQAAHPPTLSLDTQRVDIKFSSPRSATDGRFKVPLTAMFKRSSSAPAPRARISSSDLQQVAVPRRDSFSAAPPSSTRATMFDNCGTLRGDFAGTAFERSSSREGTGHVATDSVSSVQTFSPDVATPLALPRTDGGIGVNDTQTHEGLDAVYNFVASAFPSSPLFEHENDALSSPATSPVATPIVFSWGHESSDIGTPTSISDMMGEAYATAPSPSSYSSLEGWAGSPLPKQVSPISSPLTKVYHYVDGPESPGIMEKAFDAAACAITGYGDWQAHGVLGPAPSPYAWGSDDVFSSYAFPAVHCRQDNF